MSVDIIQPFSSAPRLHETISFSNDGASKCAEIFVTNNADKWTFFCAYCQKATIDIGAFICHIRLEHLNRHTDLTVGNQTTEPSNVTNLIQNADVEVELMAHAPDLPPQDNIIIKEEVTMASNQENLLSLGYKKENLIADKNSAAKSSQSCKEKLNEEFFAITAIGQDSEHQEQHKEIVQVVYLNEGAANKTTEINTKHEQNKDNDKKNNVNNSEATSSNDDNDEIKDGTDLKQKCSFCKKTFKTTRTLSCHIKTIHEKTYRLQYPFKCNVCQKGLKTKGSLKIHLITHSRDTRLPCPVCAEKHKKKNFVAHVRTHESDSCFPCRECGKIFSNPKLRMKHWKKHATEKPYICKICHCRFLKKQYLTHHLKSHNQYECSFCSSLYNAPEPQRSPYVCEKCENLPEGLVPEVTIATENTADLTGENQTNTQDITINIKNMPGSFDYSNASINDDDGLNDSETDLQFIDEWHNDNIPSGSSSVSNAPQTITTPKEGNKKMHKCQYCNREFISERSLVCHSSKMHYKNEQSRVSRFICRYCKRTFQTRSGLALHHKTHDKNNQFQCPLCPLTEFRESSFITHVLLHESELCFPCQVCAKIFSSNAQRLEHWNTHIEERPHGCKLCYRRFYQKNVLKNHMKSHGLYYCHFCANDFHSTQIQHHPYACTKCKKLPVVKSKLEKGRSLANKKHKLDLKGEE